MSYDALRNFDLKKQQKKKNEKKEEPMAADTTKIKVEPQKEEVINYDIPDRQYGDLYCVLCDSHMNSEQIWESHIKGKKHNRKERKGDTAESKYEYVKDVPTIQKELDKETRPLVGLDNMCEMIRVNQPPVYQCFLCSASLTTTKMLLEHAMGIKHQMAFLKLNDKEQFALVDASALSKSALESIVQDLALKYEQEHGREQMGVKKEIKSGSSGKRSSDVGDGPHTSLKYSSYPPAPKTSKSSARPKASRFSPPPKSARYSPPPKSARYSPPSKSARYSPPPKSSRYSSPSPPPRSARYSSPSPPPKSSRTRERNLDSEWKRVSPVRERSNERRHSDRSHFEDEKWKRIDPDSTFYRRMPTNDDSDPRFERADNCSRRWLSPDAGKNCSDLRAVLEQKKSLGMTSAYARSNVDASAVSSESNISDTLVRLVEDMAPDMFLWLTLFKLDNIQVQDMTELKLLDRVANKATTIAMDVKNRLAAADVKAKYKESLAQNGLSHQGNSMTDSSQNNPQFNQNLDSLIGHYKARKTTAYDGVGSKDSYSNRLIASEQYIGNGSSHHPLNTSQCRNASETASSFDSGWNQRSSTSSLPFQGFSSTPTNIPGLTLTEDQPSAAMSQFAQAAQNIFGTINVPSTPTNPYQNEDYNRLNYRY